MECYSHKDRAYTLIELLIVVAIIGMVASIGIPSMVRTMEKGPVRQALADIVDGCAQARAQAILKGSTMAFVIRAEDGGMSVRAASSGRSDGLNTSMGGLFTSAATSSSGGLKKFSGTLHDDIAIEELRINLADQMESDEAVVRFYSNGVSDEMTMVISFLLGEQHKITLDPVLGVPEVEKLR